MTLPEVKPESDAALALINAAKLIFDSDKWWKWVGAANAEASKKHMWISEVESTKDAKWPFAILIDIPVNDEVVAVGDGNEFDRNAEIQILIEAEIDERHIDSYGDAYFAFINPLDAVVKQMKKLSGKEGRLNLQYIRRETPVRSADAENADAGNYFQSKLILGYR